MPEEFTSFEELARDAERGLAPDEMRLGDEKPDTQYAMDDVRKLNTITEGEPAIAIPEPTDAEYEAKKKYIFDMLTALRDSKDATRISNLNRALLFSKPPISAESYPHIMREVRIALKFNAEAFFNDMRKNLIKRIGDGDEHSVSLLGYLLNDLSFMKSNGVDIRAISQEIVQAAEKNLAGVDNLRDQGYVINKFRELSK
jgi:hypothetical protein